MVLRSELDKKLCKAFTVSGEGDLDYRSLITHDIDSEMHPPHHITVVHPDTEQEYELGVAGAIMLVGNVELDRLRSKVFFCFIGKTFWQRVYKTPEFQHA